MGDIKADGAGRETAFAGDNQVATASILRAVGGGGMEKSTISLASICRERRVLSTLAHLVRTKKLPLGLACKILSASAMDMDPKNQLGQSKDGRGK